MRRGARLPQPQVDRFSLGQRAEHFALLILFNLLALTGLPQKYSHTGFAQRIVTILGGIDLTRAIHRTAAVVLMALGVWHLANVVLTRRRPVRRHDMSVGPQDIKEFFGDIKYMMGTSRARPQFGRFDYRQKFEYWAVLWGTVIMAVTGLIMWFPVVVTHWLPGLVVPASRVAHGGEALLALFAVIIWHFYNAHFRPDIFPMDPAMFSGKIDVERLRHEHLREYEALQDLGALPLPESDVPPGPPDDGAHARPGSVGEDQV